MNEIPMSSNRSIALIDVNNFYVSCERVFKAGVMLSEIVSNEGVQTDLFNSITSSPKSAALMKAIDGINEKMGKESIKLASEGFKRPWKMRQENKSPSYTTIWNEVLKVG